MDVIRHSKKTKQQAEELLKYGDVIKVLSKYGKVFFAGSYKYNLMYGPDIDLVVTSEDPEKSSYQALTDFIKQRKFQKYQLGDFSKFPHKGRPQDIIIVLIHEHKGRRWEIEIWFKKMFSDFNTSLEKLILKAPQKQKQIILELKHQREIAGITKNKLDSATIYNGVLMKGKTKLEDFKLQSA